MKITSCRFERAATQAADEPRAEGPDVVFMGRSNVGKSSLINRMLGVDGLARTSSQPGRTQSVNFYRINETVWFVDLPGYGYAKVPLAVRDAWKPMIDSYLDRRRPRIAIAMLVVDARREPTETDRSMRDWLSDREIPYLVSATKVDKLSGNQRTKAEGLLRREYGEPALGGAPVLVSAKTGHGLREVWRHVDRTLEVGRP